MDAVQKFVSQNQHQLGYIMQEASRQWIQNDPVGALTVGTCKAFIDKHGDYHQLQEKVETLLASTEQKPKFVYGLFDNTGDGDEHYWHLGVFLTEEEAYEHFKDALNHGARIGEIEVF